MAKTALAKRVNEYVPLNICVVQRKRCSKAASFFVNWVPGKVYRLYVCLVVLIDCTRFASSIGSAALVGVVGGGEGTALSLVKRPTR